MQYVRDAKNNKAKAYRNTKHDNTSEQRTYTVEHVHGRRHNCLMLRFSCWAALCRMSLCYNSLCNTIPVRSTSRRSPCEASDPSAFRTTARNQARRHAGMMDWRGTGSRRKRSTPLRNACPPKSANPVMQLRLACKRG